MTRRNGIFSGNQLKMLALLAMTCDHVGKFLLPSWQWLQIFGRLAYPIFAYMIAEGCAHTKNRRRYIGMLAISALLCQSVYGIMMHSLYQCIMVTFTLSVGLICLFDYALKKRRVLYFAAAACSLLGVYFAAEILPRIFLGSGFYIDYGFWGVMLPVFVYHAQGKARKLMIAFVVLMLIAANSHVIQWFSLAAIPLLALYNGKRGVRRMKYLFYIYYPVHLVVIYLLGLWV